MFQVFARPKPCRIMMLLREGGVWHLSKLAKGSDTTYVYVTHLITRLAKAGLVGVESKGKMRIVKLTERGVAVANAIHELSLRLQG